MTEQEQNGNDQTRSGANTLSQYRPLRGLCKRQGKMTISARSTAAPAGFVALRGLRWSLAAALFAAVVATSGTAEARRAGWGAYNGTWNVVFTTRAGNCSATNSVPFAVYGTRVSSAGGGKVTGGISRGGVVSVHIQVGLSHASSSGRLAGNFGAGRWSGIITGDRCSGIWQAMRS
jgi:hypothetical protein